MLRLAPRPALFKREDRRRDEGQNDYREENNGPQNVPELNFRRFTLWRELAWLYGKSQEALFQGERGQLAHPRTNSLFVSEVDLSWAVGGKDSYESVRHGLAGDFDPINIEEDFTTTQLRLRDHGSIQVAIIV